MKKCPDCEVPVCDFCKHYDFNGNENGAYTGDGYCNLLKEPKEPHDDCDQFHCEWAEECEEDIKKINKELK